MGVARSEPGGRCRHPAESRGRGLPSPLPRALPAEPLHGRPAPRRPLRRHDRPWRAVGGGQSRLDAVCRANVVVTPCESRYDAAPSDHGSCLLDPYEDFRCDRGSSAGHHHRWRICSGSRGRGRARDRRPAVRCRSRRRGCRSSVARRRLSRGLRTKSGTDSPAVRVGRRNRATGGRYQTMANAQTLTRPLTPAPVEAAAPAAAPALRSLPAPVDVSILIVTWNSERFIERCLEAIPAACDGFTYEVIIHDNASADATLARIDSEANVVLRSSNNDGFARGTNEA